jgi:uncharacterized protein YidB (DUF937 family)
MSGFYPRGKLQNRKETVMGLIEELLSGIPGSTEAKNNPQPDTNPLAEALKKISGNNPALGKNLLSGILSMLQQHGGLTEALDKFRHKGMDNEVDSWVGTGPNTGISDDQLQQVLGSPVLQELAVRYNISFDWIKGAVAKLLPEVVNQLTPQGRVPDEHKSLIDRLLEMVKKSG